MTSKVRTPFPYYGSKAHLAPWIASHLGAHVAYVEPYCGSAAVLMGKPPVRFEVINDLNGDVVNFYRVLRDSEAQLLEALRLTPYARDEFCASAPIDVGSAVERARRFFVRTSMSFSGTMIGYSSGTPKKTGAKPASFARRVDEILPVVAERLRRVEIENVDALTLLRRWSQPGTVVYLDPPYLGDVRKGAGGYVQDAAGGEHHNMMLDAVNEFRGRVVLSGYSSPLYRDRLPESAGWRQVDQVRHASSSAHGGADRGARIETLWIREPLGTTYARPRVVTQKLL